MLTTYKKVCQSLYLFTLLDIDSNQNYNIFNVLSSSSTRNSLESHLLLLLLKIIHESRLERKYFFN